MTKSIRNKLLAVLTSFLLLVVMVMVFNLSQVSAEASEFVPSGNICVQEGASIRVDKAESSGIRFHVFVNKGYFDGLNNATAGATIVPYDYATKTIREKGEFSLLNMMNVIKESDLPFAYTDSQMESYNEDYYKFTITIAKILDKNYARDYICVGYVRVAEQTENFVEISGTKIENGYYASSFDLNSKRSVYEVAYRAYHSNVDYGESETIIKGFMDGVAVIENDNGLYKITNNSENYTSPYSIINDGSSYYLNTLAKSVIYNGNTAKLPIKNGNESINQTSSKFATISNESITLRGMKLQSRNPAMFNDVSIAPNMAYYGLNGNYGVGTYLDISFTGNAIPNVMFFADTVDGNLSGYGEGKQGLLIVNGFKTNASTGQSFPNTVRFFGPQRIYGDVWSSHLIANDTNEDLNAFAFGKLANDKQYRYVIGTSEKSGIIYVDMRLFNVTDNVLVKSSSISTTLETANLSSGNIVIYPSFQQGTDSLEETIDTTFTLNNVYVESYNALDGCQESVGNANGGTLRIRSTANSCYTNNGEGYGLGTYVDVLFTGNNLPIITFLTNQDTESIVDGAGIIIVNGLANDGADNQNLDQLRIAAPNKFTGTNVKYNGYAQVESLVSNKPNAKYPKLGKLSQSNLDANTDYQLIVGAIEENGNVILDMTFINKTTNTLTFSYKVDTTVTVSAMKTELGLGNEEELKGFINVNGAYKGRDTSGNALATEYQMTIVQGKVKLVDGIKYEATLKGAYPGNVNYVNYKTANGSSWVSEHDTLGTYGLGTYFDIDFVGNNLPILTLFASEDTAGIAEGSNLNVKGAGILLLNGIDNGSGGEKYFDRFRIFGPYKYGAKDSDGNVIYNHAGSKISATNTNGLYPNLYKLGQNSLEDGVNYKLIIGAIEVDGKICLDMQFINVTENAEIFSYLVDTTITVAEMKTILGIEENEELQGLVLVNGAYKGRDASNNALGTTFSITISNGKN